MNRRCYEPDERRPCGVIGLSGVALRMEHSAFGYPFGHRVDLSDCLVARPTLFRLVIWEPLLTKAPAPPKARPHCCYVQTIVFYHFPHISTLKPSFWRPAGEALRPGKRGFQEWDQIQSRLGWDDVVEFEGEHFVTGGGHVVWARKRWWMMHGARRQQAVAA